MNCWARLPGVLLAALGLIGSAQTAFAQTYTWNRDASDSWNTAGNWNPAVIPNGQGVTAVFGDVITADRTVTLGSNVTLGTLSFQNATHKYTIGGSATLSLDNGPNPALITVGSSVTANQEIDPVLAAIGDVTLTNDSTTSVLTLARGISLGTHTLTVNGAGTVTLGSTGGVTGSAGSLVVVNGPGTLRLATSNSGVKFVVSGGTLVAGSNNSLSAGSFTADLVTINNNATLRFEFPQSSSSTVGITLGSGGGQLDASAAVAVSLSGAISGGGSLTKTGTGTLALSGVNTYTGDTIIRNGALRLEGNAPSGAAGVLGNATSAVLLGDNIGANSTALLVGTSTPWSIARDITVVASAAPGASTVTIGSDLGAAAGTFTGTLTLNRSVILASGNFGRITGTGGVTIGSGVTTFTSSASDFTGTVTLQQGTLAISADAQLGAASNGLLFTGGTLRATGATPFGTSRGLTLGYVNGVTPSGIIDVQNTDTLSGFTISSPITGDGPLRKIGPGILTLSAANANGYTTFVDEGTLRVTAAGVLSPNSVLSVSAGATVKLNGFSQQVVALRNPDSGNPGTIDLGSTPGTVLTIGRQGLFESTYNFTGAITGTGDLVKTGLGIQQLGGVGSITGTTTVRQGVLEVTAAVPSAGAAVRLGDPNFSDLDAVLFNTDKSTSGFGRPLTVADGTGTRTIGHQLSGTANNGSTVTFSGPITLGKDLQIYAKADGNGVGAAFQLAGAASGSGGLVKLGGGVATLAADNSYTGTTTVLKGVLVIGGLNNPNGAARSSSGFVVRNDWNVGLGPSFNPNTYSDGLTYAELAIYDFSPNANRIGDVDVTLAHGKFTYWGQSAGASSESFRNLVLDRGPNTLTMNTANSASITSATISMTGGFVRNNASTLLVVSTVLGNPDGQDFTRVLAATAPTLLGGGGAAGSTNISIIPWAYHDTDPNSGAATSTETFLTYGPTGLRPLADSEYVTSLTAPGTLNNIRIIATSTTLTQNQTINSLRYGLSANGTITLTGQKLTINSGAILSTGNLLTFNGGEIAFGSAEGIIHTTVLGNVVINSVISGSGGLTSNVANGLTLNGANTYTGPTTINTGGVSFNSAASFGAGGDPIRFRNSGPGGSMTYTAAGPTTLPNPIEIGPSSNGIISNNGGTLTLTGLISGTSTNNLFPGVTFSGTGTIELRAANTFTAWVGLNTGTLGIAADNNLGNSSNQLSLGSGTSNNPTLRLDDAGITLARQIIIGGNATINTNGFDATISGSMVGGQSSYTLTKTGAGTLTFTGTSTSLAATTVAGGTLRVNGVLTNQFSNGPVTVASGGTLGGSGTVDRAVTLNDGGTLAPGAGVGMLTVRTLGFAANSNAAYEWEAGSTAQDNLLVTTGPVNLTGVHVTVKLYDRGLGLAVTPNQQFPLVTVHGLNTITGFDPANFTVVFADTPNWSTNQYGLGVGTVGGDSVLYLTNIAPVPEPSGLLAVAGAGLLLAARRRVLASRRVAA
jgi:autotransporter-associated beta strand protein